MSRLVFFKSVIEPYVSKLNMKLDKVMELDMSTATLIYDIHVLLNNIFIYLKLAAQKVDKNHTSAKDVFNYIFLNISIILHGSLERDNVIIRLNKFSKSNLELEEEYKQLVSSFENIRDAVRIDFNKFRDGQKENVKF